MILSFAATYLCAVVLLLGDSRHRAELGLMQSVLPRWFCRLLVAGFATVSVALAVRATGLEAGLPLWLQLAPTACVLAAALKRFGRRLWVVALPLPLMAIGRFTTGTAL